MYLCIPLSLLTNLSDYHVALKSGHLRDSLLALQWAINHGK